jgi:hypothetical protein
LATLREIHGLFGARTVDRSDGEHLMVAQAACAARCVSEAEWETLLERFADHTVYHTLPWLRTLVASHKLQLHLIAVDTDDRADAIWPLLETRKGPLRIVGSPLPGWSTAYLGPLFAEGADIGASWRAFMASAPLRRASYIALKAIGSARCLDLSKRGFQKIAEFDTYRIDLRQPQDVLWGRLRAVCRNEIRKSQRAGVEIHEEADEAFVDPYWSMTCETFARTQARPTHTREFVALLWRNLHGAGMVRVISAWRHRERIASVVLLRDHGVMYYWGSASHLEHRRLCAHRLLLWEAIAGAQQEGLKQFDLISTAGGPGQFKKSFGPDEVTIATHWERSASPLVAAAKSLYERYQRQRQFGTRPPALRILGNLASGLIGRGSRRSIPTQPNHMQAET